MKERPSTALPSALKVRKLSHCCWKKTRPNIASTMLGVPATTSTADSTARASPLGGRTRSARRRSDAEGRRDQRSTSRAASGPDQRVFEAAAFGLVERRVRAFEEQAEVEVLGAPVGHVGDDRAGDRDQRRTPPPRRRSSRGGRAAASCGRCRAGAARAVGVRRVALTAGLRICASAAWRCSRPTRGTCWRRAGPRRRRRASGRRARPRGPRRSRPGPRPAAGSARRGR